MKKDPELEHDAADYWLRGNRNVDRRSAGIIYLPHLCKTCRSEDFSNEWNECGFNPRVESQDMRELQLRILASIQRNEYGNQLFELEYCGNHALIGRRYYLLTI